MTAKHSPATALSTHRAIQLSTWQERGSANRVRYYCNAIKAASIGNYGAAAHFTHKAQKWERIRVRALLRELGEAA